MDLYCFSFTNDSTISTNGRQHRTEISCSVSTFSKIFEKSSKIFEIDFDFSCSMRINMFELVLFSLGNDEEKPFDRPFLFSFEEIRLIEFIRWLVKVSTWVSLMFNVSSKFSNERFVMVQISVRKFSSTFFRHDQMKIFSAGSMTYLVDYERQRQIQSLARLLSIDSLNRLYSTSFSPIVALRSVGLTFVNEFSPLKVNKKSNIFFLFLYDRIEFFLEILCKTSSTKHLNESYFC